MRTHILSFLLQATSMPVLGAAARVPVPWIYGLHEASSNPTTYAPQLELRCQLNLKTSGTVQSDFVYVDDIATCIGPHQLCQEIRAVAVAPSPMPGHSLRFTGNELLDVIKKEFSSQLIVLEGGPQVEVIAAAYPVNMGAVRVALEERLAAQTGPLRISIQSLRIPILQKLRHENYEFEFPDLDAELKKLGQFPRKTFVNLRTLARDARSGSYRPIEWMTQLSVRVEVFAVVAKRRIMRGFPIKEEDIELRWLPYQENIVRDSRELDGKSLRAAIHEGQPFRIFDLYQEPDVKRGDRVEATVLSGGVKMNSVGQAMESGTVGQKVRVQLDSTKRQVIGLIVARSQVEVHLP